MPKAGRTAKRNKVAKPSKSKFSKGSASAAAGKTKAVGKKKAPAPKPVIEEEESEEEDDEEQVTGDEKEDEDSEEAEEESKEKAPKKIKTKANRFQEAKEDEEEPKEPRGVIYLGHIPKGFFEPQMRKYFSQFGTVTRLRLSRSKKSAESKGYAFIEFAEESVAKIVAQTMNRYLMFEKVLVCEYIPKEKRNKHLFKGCKTIPKDRRAERRLAEREMVNDRPTIEVNGKSVTQLTTKQVNRRKNADQRLKAVLEQLEIDYDINTYLTGDDADNDDEELAKPKLKGKKKGRKTAAEAPAAAPAKVAVPAEAVTSKKKVKKKVKKG
eukprot:TRINITY_DN82232_c0_g1_i1.p1 TRINITY_DN82232_c0_g1~~TRINITY_DN82232_c0_g1_i1.p1  ORF type:complete len:324 (+),score=104.13 TRINITY_DN82232_c0_g1_i1:70-1041(+)